MEVAYRTIALGCGVAGVCLGFVVPLTWPLCWSSPSVVRILWLALVVELGLKVVEHLVELLELLESGGYLCLKPLATCSSTSSSSKSRTLPFAIATFPVSRPSHLVQKVYLRR